jgi:hypothetical protein
MYVKYAAAENKTSSPSILSTRQKQGTLICYVIVLFRMHDAPNDSSSNELLDRS